MKKLTITFAALLLVLVQAASAQTVKVDWVRGTDFSKFHTFTWATSRYPINDPDANLGMANAVKDELSAKGVQYVDPKSTFDVFVTYNAKTTQDPKNTSKQILTLSVRIFAGNNTVIWSASVNVPWVNDKAQNGQNARALIATMFAQYPPKE